MQKVESPNTSLMTLQLEWTTTTAARKRRKQNLFQKLMHKSFKFRIKSYQEYKGAHVQLNLTTSECKMFWLCKKRMQKYSQ